MKHKIEIVNFSEELKEYIKVLNYEWLEKYFRIEKGDVVSLSKVTHHTSAGLTDLLNMSVLHNHFPLLVAF